MAMKTEGYGATQTRTPNTTDRVREVSSALDRPSLGGGPQRREGRGRGET